MAKEIVSVLKVNTADSEKTIKGLREEIKSLKTQLESAEIGSEQFTEASKALAEAQNELKTAMTATKATVENADGSYNALVQTMSELKKEWRATADEVKRNELGQQIDNINTQLKELDASVGNYQRNVGNYAESFSEAMKSQQEATEVTRAKFESIQKVASGLASGYAAVQGAMALMGVENEKLEKTFVKLQAAIALAQGIGGLKDLVEGLGLAKVAFKGCQMGADAFIGTMSTMKAVLVGTGIGAFVIAIGSLVQYLMTLEDEAEDATTALEKLNAEIEKSNRQLKWGDAKDDTKILKDYIKAVEEAGNDVKKLRKAEEDYQNALKANSIADAENAYNVANSNFEKAKEKYLIEKEKANSTINYKDKLTEEQLNEMWNNVLKLETEVAQAEKAMFEARAKSAQESAAAIIKEDEKRIEEQNKLAEKKKKKDQENARIEKENAVNAEKEKQEAINAIIKEYTEKRADIDTEKNFRKQETEVKYDAKETDHPVQAIQNEIDKLSELRQIRLEAHNERLQQIDELLSSELISAEMRMELETEKSNLIRENALEEQRFIIENSKLQKDRINEEKKLKQQQVSATISTTKSMLSAVSDLMKDGSKEQKGVASAIATMDALQAANGAYAAMASIPVVGPALGIAAAAAALASGYANVKAIWAVDESGSNTPSLGTASVTPTFNAEQAMPVEYTRNIMTDSEMETINQPTKVVVLESDISEVQNRVQVRESNATF